jgi:glutathione S-transferase
MKLYYSPGASSLAPHIVLCEAGIPVELVKVDLRTKKLPDGGDFTEINPKGYVPMLALDDGHTLTEIGAIVQYVADHRPETRLAPRPDEFDRYRLQEWLSFVSSELHKSFSPLFSPAASEDWKKAARARLETRFDWLVGQVTGRKFLMGDEFTVADAYLFTVLSWGRHVQIDLARWPVLAEYVARVAARPAVQQAMREEGLIK